MKAYSIFHLISEQMGESFKFMGKDYLKILKFILIMLRPIRYPAVIRSFADKSKLKNFDSNLLNDLGIQIKLLISILFPWRYITLLENNDWKQFWTGMNDFNQEIKSDIIDFNLEVGLRDLLIIPAFAIHLVGPFRYLETCKLYWNSNIKLAKTVEEKWE